MYDIRSGVGRFEINMECLLSFACVECEMHVWLGLAVVHLHATPFRWWIIWGWNYHIRIAWYRTSKGKICFPALWFNYLMKSARVCLVEWFGTHVLSRLGFCRLGLFLTVFSFSFQILRNSKKILLLLCGNVGLIFLDSSQKKCYHTWNAIYLSILHLLC